MANMKGANSTEFDENTAYPVIGLITEWQDENGDTQTTRFRFTFRRNYEAWWSRV